MCNYSLSLFNENASALKPGGCGARQPRCRLTHAAKGCLSASRDAAVTADCLNRSFRAHSSSPQRGAGVEFHVSGRAIRRGDPARRIAPQLSMANEPDGNGLIEWHVRAVPDGRFSNHVYRTRATSYVSKARSARSCCATRVRLSSYWLPVPATRRLPRCSRHTRWNSRGVGL